MKEFTSMRKRSPRKRDSLNMGSIAAKAPPWLKPRMPWKGREEREADQHCVSHCKDASRPNKRVGEAGESAGESPDSREVEGPGRLGAEGSLYHCLRGWSASLESEAEGFDVL